MNVAPNRNVHVPSTQGLVAEASQLAIPRAQLFG